MSDIIKTTARFQEADEPIKQKPILQVDPLASGNMIQLHPPLPNTIRASIDSGRDNPFRPDGKIYKSADPIVDFYKFGPNQSRTNSPTDSQLLMPQVDGIANKNGKDAQRRKKKNNENKKGADSKERKSCWRRWFCCCCCCQCFNRENKSQADRRDSTNGQITIITHEIEPYNRPDEVTSARQTKVMVLDDRLAAGGQVSSGKGKQVMPINIEFVKGDEDKELAGIEDNKPQEKLDHLSKPGGSTSEEGLQRQAEHKANKSRCVVS